MDQTPETPVNHPVQAPQMRRPTMEDGAGMQIAQNVQPAGFWIRFLAYVIDTMILSIVFYGMAIPLGILTDISSPEPSTEALASMAFLYLFFIVIYLAYVIYFYTQKGGTLGKLAFNIRVVNQDTGAKLTWGQVILRETLGKFLSALILYIGFFMAGLRKDKKAFHDLMASSQCLRKK